MLEYHSDSLIQKYFETEQELRVYCLLVSTVLSSHKDRLHISRYLRILSMVAMSFNHIVKPFRGMS